MGTDQRVRWRIADGAGILVLGATLAFETSHPTVGILAWGVGILLWLGFWIRVDSLTNGLPLPLRIDYHDALIAFGLILWALVWRLWRLDTYPTTLLYDEVQFGWQARAVLNGMIQHPLTSGYCTVQGPWHHQFMIIVPAAAAAAALVPVDRHSGLQHTAPARTRPAPVDGPPVL